MQSPHRRKKQPEQVRRSLLDCAAQIAVEQGLASVTIQAVAEAAGVTKGGLFHHFSSKKTLVDSVFVDILEQLDRAIDAHLEKDNVTYGRFTRAYIEAIFADHSRYASDPWMALSLSMVIEPDLRRLWTAWLTSRLQRHTETDTSPQLEIVRLAADGAWLAFTSHMEEALKIDVPALRTRLIDLTKQA